MATAKRGPAQDRGAGLAVAARRGSFRTRWAPVALGGFCVLTLSLSACAGGIGSSDTGGEAGGGEAVPYGATADEYAAALADLEPVALSYQAGASSGDSNAGKAEIAFADRVEELSGGKVTLDIVWGNAVASYDEVTEAVADGRLDLGVELPIYSPQKYAEINELLKLAPTKPSSPYFTELATSAAFAEVAWGTPELLETYEELGVTVLRPAHFEFSNALMCSSPVETAEDLDGLQIRAGSSNDFALAEGVDAAPVSLSATESYEALQRNTVDCTFGGLRAGIDLGWLEVAPYVTFPQEGAWGRNPTATVAGPGFAQLPIAAQQVVFDSLLVGLEESYTGMVDSSADVISALIDTDGAVVRIDDEAESKFTGATGGLRDAVTASDIGVDADAFDTAYDSWLAVAKSEGLASDVDYMEFAGEWKANPVDLDPFVGQLFEEVYLPHRPQ